MRFWDSSAIVPLLAEEASTGQVVVTLEADREMAVWWVTNLECISAIARREREGGFGADQVAQALQELSDLAATWTEVQPHATLRTAASRLLRVHSLRAGDALQLAAAITASEGQPATLDFVTLDERLALAAEREGFPIVIPAG